MRRFLLIGLILLGVRTAPAMAATPLSAAALPVVMDAIRASDWADAQRLAAAQPDRLVAKLVTFYRLLDPGQASAAEIAAFQHQNPDWPEQGVLTLRWNAAVAAEPDDAMARRDCSGRVPSTPAANARCAAAFAARPDVAARFARRAWVEGFEAPEAAAAFEAKFAPLLDPESNWRRFQRLALAGHVGTAEALAPALPDADRPIALAWIAVVRNARDASALVAALSEEQRRIPFLFFARVAAAPDPQSALAIWQADGVAAARRAYGVGRALFWPRADSLARALLAISNPKGAYTLVTTIPADGSEQSAERNFLAGFIALRFLDEPDLARPWFARLAKEDRAVITRARGFYWLAQTESGAARADDLARSAAFPDTFYGQLAALAAGLTPEELGERIRGAAGVRIRPMAMLHFAERELPQAAFLLGEMGAPKRARAFLIRAAETSPDAHGRALAARLAQGLGQTSAQVMIARLAGVEGEMLIRLGWPIPSGLIPAGLSGSEVKEGVILSITRQESSFDPDAVSHSGAVGLMQLLPGTADDVARKQGIALGPDGLTDPAQNIALGTAYFASLMQRFGASTPLAIAAYNAGPRNVEAWLAANGDPRMPAGAGGTDIVNWIEEIPFGETRNYVERVVEGIVVYRALLGKPAINPITRWMAAR